ncbi:MAG: hypothetical protein PVG11_06415 [Anaerolineae bacterium]|jgi:hypothetical protein
MRRLVRLLVLLLLAALLVACGTDDDVPPVDLPLPTGIEPGALPGDAPLVAPTRTPRPTATAADTAIPAGETPLSPLATPTPGTPVAAATAPTSAPRSEATPTPPPLDAVRNRAESAVLALRDQDFDALATLVHEEKGLRFSPYAYVDESALIFGPDAVPRLMRDPAAYEWGHYAGTGSPIVMPFADYYHEFIYDRDYVNAPEVGINDGEQRGNTLNNAAEFWPGSVAVDYHFPGSEQYDGIDWKTLRLVFQSVDGAWYLVGIVHSEWTP